MDKNTFIQQISLIEIAVIVLGCRDALTKPGIPRPEKEPGTGYS